MSCRLVSREEHAKPKPKQGKSKLMNLWELRTFIFLVGPKPRQELCKVESSFLFCSRLVSIFYLSGLLRCAKRDDDHDDDDDEKPCWTMKALCNLFSWLGLLFSSSSEAKWTWCSLIKKWWWWVELNERESTKAAKNIFKRCKKSRQAGLLAVQKKKLLQKSFILL